MSGADERFERALGDSPLSPDDELGAFVRDVRDAFPAEPMLAEEAHLQAIVDAARRISTGPQRPTRKETRVRFPKLRSKAAMVVAGFVVAMSSFGGLAVAGALPGTVQDRVANAVGIVDLPGGDGESSQVEDHATETEAPEPSETETPEPSETETPEPSETETPEPSETESPKADDQGENEQSGDQGNNKESQADDQGQDEQSGGQGGSGDQSEESDSGESDSGDGGSD
jgi:cytoskeletal protein RodZ